MSGCLGRLFALALLGAVLTVAWYNRHEVLAFANQILDREPEISEAVAAEAAARLDSLGEPGVSRVAFHASELQSLVEYRWAPQMPEELVRPRVALGDGRITVETDVPTARFGRIAELEEVISFLPDTTSLRAVGSFVPLDDDHIALEIHELGAAGIPIPKKLIPPILDRFRPSGFPEAGPNALAVPLPRGIGNVYVSGDSLVVAARRGGV